MPRVTSLQMQTARLIAFWNSWKRHHRNMPKSFWLKNLQGHTLMANLSSSKSSSNDYCCPSGPVCQYIGAASRASQCRIGLSRHIAEVTESTNAERSRPTRERADGTCWIIVDQDVNKRWLPLDRKTTRRHDAHTMQRRFKCPNWMAQVLHVYSTPPQ